MDTVITLTATAAGFLFLVVCALHNRRTGFKKVRRQESSVDEAILWLASVSESLSSAEEDAVATASHTSTVSAMHRASEELISLHSALRRCENPELHEEVVPEEEGMGVFALAHTRKAA